MSAVRTLRAGRRGALLLGAGILSACNALADTDGLQFVVGPEGTFCSNAATDCPAPASECQTVKCEAHRCAVENEAAGPVAAQTAGDCKVVMCDGRGSLQSTPDDADIEDDGMECTADACEGGAPVHALVAPKTKCSEAGGAVCDGAGSCVGCVDDAGCVKPETCSAAKVCACAPPCPSFSLGFDASEGRGVALDGSGNALVTGWFSGTSNFGGGPLTSGGERDIFVAKYGADGKHLWSQRFGDMASQEGRAVGADSAGNVVIAGVFAGAVDFGVGPLVSAGGTDVFLAKLDAAGNKAWSKSFGGGLDDEVTAMTVDGAGYLVLAGKFQGMVDFGGGPLTEVCAGFGDIFVAKFDPQGTHQWSKSYCLSGDARAVGIAADSQGDIVLAGRYDGSISFGGDAFTSDGADVFVAKLSSSGDHLWSKGYGAPGAQEGSGVAADKNGDLFVTGGFEGSVDFGGGALMSAGQRDVFVVKLGALDGAEIFRKGFGDKDDQSAGGVAVDEGGNAVLTGVLTGSVDFGGGALPASAAPQIFVARLAGADGGHMLSRVYGGVGPEYGAVVAAGVSSAMLLAGYFSGGIDFGLGALPYSDVDMSSHHAFLARLQLP